jgi:hypothetical protein
MAFGSECSLMISSLVSACLMLPPAPSARTPTRCPEDLPTLGKAEGFERSRTVAWTVSQGAPNHRARDVVTVPGAPAWAIAKFAYGVADKDLKEEKVTVWWRGTDCRWQALLTEKTSREDDHDAVDGVKDDGGRIFAPLPALPVGRHRLLFDVHGDRSHAEATVTVVAPGTQVVLFDIDGTLTIDDAQILKQIEAKARGERYTPLMWDGAPAVAQRWAERGYLVVYVSARPDVVFAETREWLVAKGFPPGPVLLTDKLRQAIPGERVHKYKSEVVTGLVGRAKVSLVAAYGNASTDIAVYAEAGIPKAKTFIVGPHAGKDGTQAIVYPAHLPSLESLPRATHPAPPAAGW